MKGVAIGILSGTLLISGLTYADVYRWKNSNGETSYSDQPPLHTSAEKLNIGTLRAPQPTPASAPAKEVKKTDKPSAAETNNAKMESNNAKVVAANAKVKEQNCLNARNNLGTLQQNGRVRVPGSNALASDEQRNALIKQAQNDIQTWCNQ
ncbi:DUF4124 domain-containing protein [Neisseriaceae bacterium TC5R-5]|nr:DUF4124 domain-containing protein [Neisseriaceae bacterium TC5R-5]